MRPGGSLGTVRGFVVLLRRWSLRRGRGGGLFDVVGSLVPLFSRLLAKVRSTETAVTRYGDC